MTLIYFRKVHYFLEIFNCGYITFVFKILMSRITEVYWYSHYEEGVAIALTVP
jgi:hypothetical protein